MLGLSDLQIKLLIAAFVVVLAATTVIMYNRAIERAAALEAENAELVTALDEANRTTKKLKSTLDATNTILSEKIKNETELRKAVEGFRKALTYLRGTNAEVNLWASTNIPDSVVKLLQEPATAGDVRGSSSSIDR